jgi:predicted acyltransferase (DUF342 family)
MIEEQSRKTIVKKCIDLYGDIQNKVPTATASCVLRLGHLAAHSLTMDANTDYISGGSSVNRVY